MISIAIAIVGIGGTLILRVNTFASKLLELLGRLDTKTDQLAPLSKDVVAVRQTVQSLFQITSANLAGSGTVTIQLRNLGQTAVSADPGPTETNYDISFSSAIMSAELIRRLAKDTGFEQVEIEAFGTDVTVIDVGRNRLLVKIPSTDAQVVTKFLNDFLAWLDTTYFEERQRILEEFEKPIAP